MWVALVLLAFVTAFYMAYLEGRVLRLEREVAALRAARDAVARERTSARLDARRRPPAPELPEVIYYAPQLGSLGRIN